MRHSRVVAACPRGGVVSTRPPAGRRPRPQRATPAGRRVLVVLIPILAIIIAVIAVVALTRGGGDAPVATAPTTTDVLLVEGLRRTEMADVVQAKTGIPAAQYIAATDPSQVGQTLAGTKKPTSLEGFLFPATYPVDPKKPVSDLVNYQLRTYAQRTAGINYAYAKKHNLTKYDVLIMASIVEREASNQRDRRIIAGVFYNRLKLGMRIDSDVTVHYALGSWSKELTRADLNLASPYNTRRYHGLPPGPICNPGLGAINAAANPVRTPYLYFVASTSGKVFYAKTGAEFQQAIAKAKANG